jgi:hypothetical protein
MNIFIYPSILFLLSRHWSNHCLISSQEKNYYFLKYFLFMKKRNYCHRNFMQFLCIGLVSRPHYELVNFHNVCIVAFKILSLTCVWNNLELYYIMFSVNLVLCAFILVAWKYILMMIRSLHILHNLILVVYFY